MEAATVAAGTTEEEHSTDVPALLALPLVPLLVSPLASFHVLIECSTG